MFNNHLHFQPHILFCEDRTRAEPVVYFMFTMHTVGGPNKISVKQPSGFSRP